MSILRAATKEPLLHFLAAGLALFVLFEVVSPDETDFGERVIVVDRDALLTFVQYRSKAFKPEVAAARLDAMTAEQRQRLIDDFVREEAMHREALALGMDANDYIIKRRLIQKVEFLAQGFADAAASLDEVAVQAYYEANKDDYYIEPSATFTHVFFDAAKRGAAAAHEAAAAKLEELNADRVPFANAPRHGDWFPYHLNYVERTPDFVASHFGTDMARALFALKADEQIWRGPHRSPYGAHLVLMTKIQPGHTPALEEVRRRVEDDASRAKAREMRGAAIGRIVEGYEVRIADDAQSIPGVARAQAASSTATRSGKSP